MFQKKTFVTYCQNLLKAWTKIGLDFVHFAWRKVNKMKTRANLCSKKHFYFFPFLLHIFLQYLTKLYKIEWKIKFHSNLDFIQFCHTLDFDDFKSSMWNFGFIQTGSKNGNFRLGNGKSRRNKYRSYLIFNHLSFEWLDGYQLNGRESNINRPLDGSIYPG